MSSLLLLPLLGLIAPLLKTIIVEIAATRRTRLRYDRDIAIALIRANQRYRRDDRMRPAIE